MPVYVLINPSGVAVALRAAGSPTEAKRKDVDCRARIWQSANPPVVLRVCPSCDSSQTVWANRGLLIRKCNGCGQRHYLTRRRVSPEVPKLDEALPTVNKVKILKKAGLSVIAIKEQLGISRQRVYKFLEKIK